VPEERFTGGLRTSWGFNATVPFAELTMFDAGMNVSVLGFQYALVSWSEVVSAQRVVGGLLASPGVRVRLGSGQRFVFWSFHPKAVLELSGHGA